MTPECSKKGVRLELDLQGPHMASVDSFQLKQAVLNLVLNALHATAAGGRVLVRTSRQGDDLIVAVVDDGEGMPAEVLERASIPFFTTHEEGTGLGLSLVRRVIEHHGGSLQILSAQGEGTTVAMTFPARRGR